MTQITPEKAAEFIASAEKLQIEIADKQAKAQAVIDECNQLRVDIQRAKDDLKRREQALTEKGKKLRLIQLRLYKVVNQNKLDVSFKNMLDQVKL